MLMCYFSYASTSDATFSFTILKAETINEPRKVDFMQAFDPLKTNS